MFVITVLDSCSTFFSSSV